MEPARNVVFVCLHGAAKSVIAAAYLPRLAESRGSNIRAISVGIDPAPEVPSPVVEALLKEGIDVSHFRPRRGTRAELAVAWRVVSFGCDLGDLVPEGVIPIRWDDVPLVSDGVEAARDAIVARLATLLDSTGEPASPAVTRRCPDEQALR